MPPGLTIRGTAARDARVSAEGGQVSLKLTSDRDVTAEFRLSTAAASALAGDLVQVADTLRNAANTDIVAGASGAATMYAPLASVVDIGDVVGRSESCLTLKTEDGPEQRFRFSNAELLEFAKSVVENIRNAADVTSLN